MWLLPGDPPWCPEPHLPLTGCRRFSCSLRPASSSLAKPCLQGVKKPMAPAAATDVRNSLGSIPPPIHFTRYMSVLGPPLLLAAATSSASRKKV